MNHAAEQAVLVAAHVFAAAITNMTVDDAKAIPAERRRDAVLPQTSDKELYEQFLPLSNRPPRRPRHCAYKSSATSRPAAAFLGKDAATSTGT
jgi:hypothetical protein